MKKASNPKKNQRTISGFFEKAKVKENFKNDKENELGKQFFIFIRVDILKYEFCQANIF